jgi:hypothetical protein
LNRIHPEKQDSRNSFLPGSIFVGGRAKLGLVSLFDNKNSDPKETQSGFDDLLPTLRTDNHPT